MQESLFHQVLEKVAIVALAVVDKGGEHVDLVPVVLLENHLHNLFRRVFHHGLA